LIGELDMGRSISCVGINNLNSVFQSITIDTGTPHSSFTGNVSAIIVQGSDWNGTSSTLTLAITEDAAGSKPLVTDIASTIFPVPGGSPATAFGAGYKIGVTLAASSNNIYCWFKTDAGTVDIDCLYVTFDGD
jgi:hypothetical protein